MKKIVFSLKGKELCWVSAPESSINEVKEIRGLLAFENKVKEEQVDAVYREK